MNNGTFEFDVNSLSCDCADGFTGGRCETNIDDCQGDPCQNNGTCLDGINSFSCDCVAGYQGEYCETGKN